MARTKRHNWQQARNPNNASNQSQKDEPRHHQKYVGMMSALLPPYALHAFLTSQSIQCLIPVWHRLDGMKSFKSWKRKRCAGKRSGQILEQLGVLSLNELSTIVWPCIIHVWAVINNEPGTWRKLSSRLPPHTHTHVSGLLTSTRCHFFVPSERASPTAGTRSPCEGILRTWETGGRDEGRSGRIVFVED